MLLLLHSVKDAVSGPYPDGLDAVGIPALCEAAGHVGVPAHGEMLVTAIHQAKGRKWDAVVGSLSGPDLDTDRVGRNLAECYGLYPGEQAGRIANLDRIRRRYVAFTRARNLLVFNTGGQPQARFSPISEGAARWPCVDRDSPARQRVGIAGAATRRVVKIDHLDRLVVSLVPPTLVE